MKIMRPLFALVISTLSLCQAPAAQDSSRKNAEDKLTPEASEFLSQARYLISKDDRKELLSLPRDLQADFVDQFWKKRDSDPATPVNEFKDEYFRRLRLADEMFTGEPQPGRFTDRGRIAVLYGEPASRERKPSAAGQGGPCTETWLYDGFPVVFSDKNCDGVFLLTTRDLDPIRNRNIAVAARSRSLREQRGLPFDVEVHILKKPVQGETLEGLVRLDMPYSGIWFGVGGPGFETAFAVEMELADSRGNVRWTFKDTYPVSLSADDLKARQTEKFGISVPLTIQGGLAELRAGKCRLTIVIENKTSKERIRKVAEFSF